MNSRFVALAVFAGLVVVAAQLGATYQPGAWYQGLAKPVFTPPSWLFPIAWTTLYVMIGLAGYFAWKADGLGAAVGVWLLQLILNAAWSYVMFGRHDIGLALADIAALWLSIAAFIWLTWNRSRIAAMLFVPYLAWVSFAAVLNFEVWRLNA
jgi:tryptophan-rich sensory protein